jgi:APA family basic amino acid/polyamine antiporter
MVAREEPQSLRRTLGLSRATAIGLGTMIGAGIFVFPGLAAGHAGPFAIGAVVAMLVALPASELATAMPVSGGPAVYVSRTMGPFWGTVVGVGQWAGLLFASAFYLVGFARYGIDMLDRLGVGVDLPFDAIAVGAAFALTGVHLLGTEKAGALQNATVVVLLAILCSILLYGVFGVIREDAPGQVPQSFFPFGAMPVVTTAALVFTSYLGFAQVATVSGDVRNPGRNVPLAMLSSVIIAASLYVLTIFVATASLPSERLGELGETAMVEVARTLLGPTGTIALLAAGLLATLSSANASILSGSRAVYALGAEGLAPKRVTSVSQQARVPYVSILLAGGPVIALALLGRVEVLAEVASLLHLVLYGTLCIALLLLRRRSPDWYAPSFRSPGHPVVPVAGALASFALIALMQPLSLYLGGGVVVASVIWYFTYRRRNDHEESREDRNHEASPE